MLQIFLFLDPNVSELNVGAFGLQADGTFGSRSVPALVDQPFDGLHVLDAGEWSQRVGEQRVEVGVEHLEALGQQERHRVPGRVAREGAAIGPDEFRYLGVLVAPASRDEKPMCSLGAELAELADGLEACVRRQCLFAYKLADQLLELLLGFFLGELRTLLFDLPGTLLARVAFLSAQITRVDQRAAGQQSPRERDPQRTQGQQHIGDDQDVALRIAIGCDATMETTPTTPSWAGTKPG